MAAKKKAATKKKKGPAKKKAPPLKRATSKPAPAASPDVRKLDSGWRSFIRKAVKDEPLTLEWHDPVGAPSTKTTISAAVAKKALTKAAKKSPARRGAAKKTAKKKSAKKK